MSSNKLSFYCVGERGTVQITPNYDPEQAVETLHRSMVGLGTDEDAIIDVVATHTFHQRQELKQLYRQKYGKDLVKELDSELSFSFSKTVLALMKKPEQFIIECIHQAISKSRASRLIKQLQKIYRKGLDSDEYSLLALLCPRSNDELDAIKILYKKKYEKELEDDIGFDLGEDLRSLILDMISGGREDETEVDPDKVLDDADNLHGASLVPVGEIYGTKERVLQQIFNTRSYEHLRQLIPAYAEASNSNIEDYIDSSELSVDLKEAYQAIIKLLRNEPNYYAERLREAIRGLGTDDDTLISIIVLRSEIDLREVMHVYLNRYGVSLQDDVAGDTSGDYRHILLKILNVPAEHEDQHAKDANERKLSEPELTNVEEEEQQQQQEVEEEEDELTITPAGENEEDLGHEEEHEDGHTQLVTETENERTVEEENVGREEVEELSHDVEDEDGHTPFVTETVKECTVEEENVGRREVEELSHDGEDEGGRTLLVTETVTECTVKEENVGRGNEEEPNGQKDSCDEERTVENDGGVSGG